MMAVVVLGIAAAGVLLPFSRGAAVRVEGTRRTLAARFATGAVFTDLNYANFRREVGCEYVYVPQENGMGTPKFIRASVQVYYSAKRIATINRLVSE
jgi:hypothetical protein